MRNRTGEKRLITYLRASLCFGLAPLCYAIFWISLADPLTYRTTLFDEITTAYAGFFGVAGICLALLVPALLASSRRWGQSWWQEMIWIGLPFFAFVTLLGWIFDGGIWAVVAAGIGVLLVLVFVYLIRGAERVALSRSRVHIQALGFHWVEVGLLCLSFASWVTTTLGISIELLATNPEAYFYMGAGLREFGLLLLFDLIAVVGLLTLVQQRGLMPAALFAFLGLLPLGLWTSSQFTADVSLSLGLWALVGTLHTGLLLVSCYLVPRLYRLSLSARTRHNDPEVMATEVF